ncbi:ABC transporter substrate-binding protein [Tersicoccus solisilvae]|uniref:ABC transporter substrate-binding protein n=1 Tax=Tersicoccus solisilvae TaxID=1882339 RepID=A0ABQ1NXS6_9MICC|nr:zinc ABC transporter substrate-binding protein [Tersicoccus solisilvae]GGC86941.1 ABC transporter substrate-binding protein [Tersicoccus solisilvae]
MPRPARVLSALAVAALLLPLAACGGGDAAAGSSGAASGGDGRLKVVASTDVYGDLAATVGGDAVEVTSVISGPDKDPHSYESTVRDSLAVSRADLVILNGGGYDTFMEGLVEKNQVDAAHVVDAVATSGLEPEDEHDAGSSGDASADDHGEAGHDHDHGAFNEHVWYSLPAAQKVVTAIKDRLAAARPADAATFDANATALTGRISGLTQRLAALKGEAAGGGTTRDVAITEPVPLYLLEAAGLHNVTPASFSEAIEEGGDVSPTDLFTLRTLMQQKKVALLAYNTQSESEQTRTVATAARTAGVPVVDFTETLPDGKHYADWMADNISGVESALRTAR